MENTTINETDKGNIKQKKRIPRLLFIIILGCLFASGIIMFLISISSGNTWNNYEVSFYGSGSSYFNWMIDQFERFEIKDNALGYFKLIFFTDIEMDDIFSLWKRVEFPYSSDVISSAAKGYIDTLVKNIILFIVSVPLICISIIGLISLFIKRKNKKKQ